MTTTTTVKLSALLAVSFFTAGCAPAGAPNTSTTSSKTAKSNHDDSHAADEKGHSHSHNAGDGHTHGAGPHGGTVADWGGGKYHVEFLVDHEKQQATAHVLGTDEKTPAPIKAAEGKLLLTITQPRFQADLIASPLDGEAEGLSSRFVGQHENLGKAQEFAGTISGEIDGTPYAGDFKEEPHDDHHK